MKLDELRVATCKNMDLTIIMTHKTRMHRMNVSKPSLDPDSIPDEESIRELKKLIMEFIDNQFALPSKYNVTFGVLPLNMPFHFTINLSNADMPVLSSISTRDKWRKKGIANFAIGYVESQPSIKRIAIDNVRSKKMCAILHRRGYYHHCDHAFFKDIHMVSPKVVFIEDLPAILRWLATNYVRVEPPFDPSIDE